MYDEITLDDDVDMVLGLMTIDGGDSGSLLDEAVDPRGSERDPDGASRQADEFLEKTEEETEEETEDPSDGD